MKSTDALRIAHAVKNCGLEWPTFSSDRTTDWLVKEAIMARYEHELEAEQQAHELRQQNAAHLQDRLKGRA